MESSSANTKRQPKKKGASAPTALPRAKRVGAMARPAAHRAQEPDKGNADVGREQPQQPQQRRWNPKATMMRHRAACKVLKKGGGNDKRQPDPTSGGGGSGNPRPRRGEYAPTGGEGATGVGGGAAPTGARGWPRKHTAIISLCYAAYMQQHGE